MINNHYRRHHENRRLIIQDPNDDEDAEYCDRLEWLTTAPLIKTGQQRLLILLEMELKYGAEYDSMDTWIWWMKKWIVNKNETIIMRC